MNWQFYAPQQSKVSENANRHFLFNGDVKEEQDVFFREKTHAAVPFTASPPYAMMTIDKSWMYRL